jgi:shikimate kinase
MSVHGEAIAYGAVTIVSALATGRGAAVGIDLWTKARVDLNKNGTIRTRILSDPEEKTTLANQCVRAVLDRFGSPNLGASVETDSNIPVAKGLKSSSVAGNAVVLATLAALGKKARPEEVLDIVADVNLKAGVSVTGAYDDASASLYGNVVVTDNTLRKVLRTFPVGDLTVLLLVPPGKSYTINADLKRIRSVSSQVEVAHKEALDGRYWNAMTLNGLIYAHVLKLSSEPIIESLRAGALAAGISGKGPAYAVVVEEESKEPVRDVLRRHRGDIIVSRTRKGAVNADGELQIERHDGLWR